MITNKKISDLKDYEFNNKVHNEKQIKILKQSIQEYGFDSPVIIDKENVIIAGHGRVQAAKEIGLEEIPVIIKDNLTEKQVKKYRLLDNKISELADDNIENIKIELDELQDIELNELYDLDLEDDYGDDFELPDGEKPDIETMTFTLHKDQVENVKRAMNHAKSLGSFEDTGNENGNGNALARVIETYISQNEC